MTQLSEPASLPDPLRQLTSDQCCSHLPFLHPPRVDAKHVASNNTALHIRYCLVLYSFELLVSCTRHTLDKSYSGIATAALGSTGNVITQIAIFLATYGTMTSYLIIIGDMMGPLIGYVVLSSRSI
jgi:hypothetical protein